MIAPRRNLNKSPPDRSDAGKATASISPLQSSSQGYIRPGLRLVTTSFLVVALARTNASFIQKSNPGLVDSAATTLPSSHDTQKINKQRCLITYSH